MNSMIRYGLVRILGMAAAVAVAGIAAAAGGGGTMQSAVTTSCVYTISPGHQALSANAANGSVSVSTAANCGWSAVSNAAWITIANGVTASGSGSLAYSVAANNEGAPRTGVLNIAGRSFTLTQSTASTELVRNALFVNASTSANKTSVVRLVNVSDQSGVVMASAYNESGAAVGTANFVLGTLAPYQTLTFTSEQLEAVLGYTPSAPTAKYRLVFNADLPNLEVLNFIKDIATGNLTLAQAQTDNRAVDAGAGATRNALFVNASSSASKTSVIRLINLGEQSGAISATAYNEDGQPVGGANTLLGTLGARQVLTFTSAELEARIGYLPVLSTAKYRIVFKSALPSFELINFIKDAASGNLTLGQDHLDDGDSTSTSTSTSASASAGTATVRNALFVNASSSGNKTSMIRLINLGDHGGPVFATAYDEAGNVVGVANAAIGSLGPQQMLTFSSEQLETAIGYRPAAGTQKFRIAFQANLPKFEILNFIKDVARGNLTLGQAQTDNRTGEADSSIIRNALLVNASTSLNKSSVIRLINLGDQGGAINATAYDEAGYRVGTANAALGTLGARQILTFSSAQLEAAIGYTPSSPVAKYSIVFSGSLPAFEILNFIKDRASGDLTLAHEAVKPGRPTPNANYKLTVALSGSGSVTSAPAGIDCGASCSTSFAKGASVTLSAVAATGNSFEGWGGACAGTATTCTLTMNAAKSVSASFKPSVKFVLSVVVGGSGSVTSAPAGINCSASCGASFSSGTNVTLTPVPAAGYVFSGWSGNCSGTGACTVAMSAARNVGVSFAPNTTRYTLSTARSGSGTITSAPAGIDCGATCSASFSSGTNVTLTATPAAGYSFSGWGGACSGASCTVSMTTARSVTAAFASVSSGSTYYFSDCQAGAQAGCVAGNNANAGTSPNAPKQTLAGFNLNALPAGSQILFARGGAWTDFRVMLKNMNVTAVQPLVFDAYSPAWGGTAVPWLKVAQFVGFEFGHFNDTDNDGGYTLRNLKLDGEMNTNSPWGLWLRDQVHHVTVENLEITRFAIGVHSSSGAFPGVSSLTIRNSNIHHNYEHGMLGAANDMLIEGNTIADNNMDGGGFEHGIYLGGQGRNGIIRNNNFTNNSAPNGVCNGGNLTVHGQWDGLVIEGNTITQAASLGGCYGISVTDGYTSVEFFRNLVIRGNTIANLGGCSICIDSAPNVVVENNVIVNPLWGGIILPGIGAGAGDDTPSAATIRNNSIYFTQASAAGVAIALRSNSGSSNRVISNLVYFGAGSDANHRCFEETGPANFTAFNNNLCHHAGGNGRWSSTYATLAAAQAAGFDTNGSSANPLVTVPSAGNGWSTALQAGSPAIDAGHATLSATADRLGVTRSVPDIGAYEYAGAVANYVLTASFSGSGAGTVSSSPAGINCTASCSASFSSGSNVTLTASPSAGNTFAGWSGACSGTGSCVLAMSAARAVTATFAATPSSGSATYYFSDCQAGAQAGCVAGNNDNAGTSAGAPKQTLAGVNLNALPAGAQLLFARGGAWVNFTTNQADQLENLNVTPTQPMVFDAYTPSWGGSAAPWLKTASGIAVELGGYNNVQNDGGYTFRNLKFDGLQSASWGFWLRDNLRYVTIENVEITGFSIAIHSHGIAPSYVNHFALRNSNIHHNSDMGILGKFMDSVIEGTTFESNNFSGSALSHAIYFSGGDNNIIRNNTFTNNSVANGTCNGGNVTFHGQATGMLVENNTITQVASTGGCYGFSITSGYDTPEWFRNFVIRGNTIVNLGYIGIAVHAAPGIVIENNLIRNTQTSLQHAINVGANDGAPATGDDVATGAIVRNNIVCYSQPNANSRTVVINAPATGTETGTIYRTGADASTGACATAGAPAAALQASRLSGPAPLAVLFDSTASSKANADAFRELTYSFNFGDANCGTWAIGGGSKNVQARPGW